MSESKKLKLEKTDPVTMSNQSEAEVKASLVRLCSGLTPSLLNTPKNVDFRKDVNHAPKRNNTLDAPGKRLVFANALRYIPKEHHRTFLPVFKSEWAEFGHIYMHSFRPDYIKIMAYPLDWYPAKTKAAASIMLMIMNNLSDEIAQYPDELVTYGGNGQVFSNWAQFLITMNYLSTITETQTLHLYSGHPLGVFPSTRDGPQVILTNGMVIPNYSTRDQLQNMFALGVSQYGQMTAGSYCYIGPQGIVHGTTITVMNACRNHLRKDDMAGVGFLTAGLGGMSGAQAKAAKIAGCVGVIAEVDKLALVKRHEQGWLDKWSANLDEVIAWLREFKTKKQAVSIGYLGNVVDIWEKLVEVHKATGEILCELGSDQSSCHNVEGGGYLPADMTFEEAQNLLAKEPAEFLIKVRATLLRHINAIDYLNEKAGMYFWDYGNTFLFECRKSGANIVKPGTDPEGIDFKYPSYVQHIMGNIFSMGFGPFRWVCTSCKEEDLDKSDGIALSVMSTLAKIAPPREAQQYRDNIKWLEGAKQNKLVVGSQARILYTNQEGRRLIALAFNEAVKKGEMGPIVISRDHHDVSGTDSPFRETSNIYDGSAFCADMAVHNFTGDAVRGAHWVSLHNGGGVGWGLAINGGFGMLLDGGEDSKRRADMMLRWDVSNGVSRRAWSGNEYAYETIKATMEREKDLGLKVTLPEKVDDALLDEMKC